jgi:hypothetical protein
MSINQMFLISSFRYLVYNFCGFRCIFPALYNYYSIWMSTFFCSDYILSTKVQENFFELFSNMALFRSLILFCSYWSFWKALCELGKVSYMTLKKLLMNKNWFDDLNFQIKFFFMSVNFEREFIFNEISYGAFHCNFHDMLLSRALNVINYLVKRALVVSTLELNFPVKLCQLLWTFRSFFCGFRSIFLALDIYYSIWMNNFCCSGYILSIIKLSFN